MEITVKSGQPDGMHVTFKTYIMTWDELKKLIDIIAKIEGGGLKNA